MTLPEYIQSKMQTPFCWGANDCMTFTIGWVEEVTGKKYLPRQIWKNEMQALRRIKKEGGLEKAFDKHFCRIDPSHAVDGDICVINNAAGIISGRNFFTIEEKKGFVSINRSLIKNAWSIR